VQQLRADPAIAGVATALQAPGAEPWVTVDIEGGNVPAFGTRFNQVDAEFFNLYQVQTLTGRRFVEGDAGPASTAVIVNRNFAEGSRRGDVLGRRFSLRACGRSGLAARAGTRALGTKWSASSAICQCLLMPAWCITQRLPVR
jgi:hypothetical protein